MSEANSPNAPGGKARFRALVAFLIFVGIAPTAIFSAFVLLEVVDLQKRAVESEMRGTVRALAAALDRELVGRIRSLEVLAEMEELDKGDLDEFHRELVKVQRNLGHGWSALVLVDAKTGKQILNSQRPFGTELPVVAEPNSVKRAIDTLRPIAHGVIERGALIPEPLVLLSVPVLRMEGVRYAINGAFRPAVLNEILVRQAIPPDWIAAVVDGNQKIVARSRAAESFVAKPVTRSLAERLQRDEPGFFIALTQEGQEVHTILERIPGNGWWLVLGAPAPSIDKLLKRSRNLFGWLAVGVIFAVASLTILVFRNLMRVREGEIALAEARASMEAEQRKALMAARDQAELASRAKSELLANLSHELRTPLNGILGSADALLEGSLGAIENAKHREYIDGIRQSGTRLAEVLGDLLDLAALEAGKEVLTEEEVDLAQCVESCLRLMRPRALAKRQRLSAELLTGLPKLRADGRRLKQMLLNLIGNAVKFTPEDGTITVGILPTRDGGLEIAVSDNGIGMTEAAIRHGLTPFGQAEPAHTRREGGVGLGLPLVAGFALLHGGRLDIQSAPGLGTRACVLFPKERVLG